MVRIVDGAHNLYARCASEIYQVNMRSFIARKIVIHVYAEAAQSYDRNFICVSLLVGLFHVPCGYADKFGMFRLAF